MPTVKAFHGCPMLQSESNKRERERERDEICSARIYVTELQIVFWNISLFILPLIFLFLACGSVVG
jgi:hypothetical protein